MHRYNSMQSTNTLFFIPVSGWDLCTSAIHFFAAYVCSSLFNQFRKLFWVFSEVNSSLVSATRRRFNIYLCKLEPISFSTFAPCVDPSDGLSLITGILLAPHPVRCFTPHRVPEINYVIPGITVYPFTLLWSAKRVNSYVGSSETAFR